MGIELGVRSIACEHQLITDITRLKYKLETHHVEEFEGTRT